MFWIVVSWKRASWGGSFLAACASQAQALKASPVWATEEIWVQLEKAPQGTEKAVFQ